MTANLASVVICTYNRAASLRQSLDTVTRQETGGHFAYEVVVVDDGSADDTRAVVEEAAAREPVPVRYVLHECRAGIGSARNRGVREAHGEWVVFFDDDQLAEPCWLGRLIEVAKNQGAVCVGGPRCLDLAPQHLAALGPVCRGVLGEHLYLEPPSVLEGKELPSTGNLLIARRVFEQIGVFEAGFSGCEDTEFLNRLRAGGFAIWTAPRAMCAHMIPAYRTQARYFRWVSLRWGFGFAKSDANRRGRFSVMLLCFARLAQALAVHLPRLIFARSKGDAAAAQDRRLLLWRAEGYARMTLWLLAPRLFSQKRFLVEMEFRKEREMFAGNDGKPA